jgi:hypothetical protein
MNNILRNVEISDNTGEFYLLPKVIRKAFRNSVTQIHNLQTTIEIYFTSLWADKQYTGAVTKAKKHLKETYVISFLIFQYLF